MRLMHLVRRHRLADDVADGEDVQYVGVHLDLSIDETAVDHRQTKPNQTKPNQTKPNQTKPNQAKPSQAKPSQAKPSQAKLDCYNNQ